MSATAEAPVVTQDYVSSCHNLLLVRTPVRKRALGEGSDFITSDPDRIQFVEGRYQATTQEDIDFLDDHPNNGLLFHKVGFGADGRTSDNSAEIIASVVKMAFSGDYQKIADILVAERGTYSRPDVIAACETVLNEVDAAPTEQPGS